MGIRSFKTILHYHISKNVWIQTYKWQHGINIKFYFGIKFRGTVRSRLETSQQTTEWWNEERVCGWDIPLCKWGVGVIIIKIQPQNNIDSMTSFQHWSLAWNWMIVWWLFHHQSSTQPKINLADHNSTLNQHLLLSGTLARCTHTQLHSLTPAPLMSMHTYTRSAP